MKGPIAAHFPVIAQNPKNAMHASGTPNDNTRSTFSCRLNSHKRVSALSIGMEVRRKKKKRFSGCLVFEKENGINLAAS